jgi:hypothetical protein
MMKRMLDISECIPTICSMGNADLDEMQFEMQFEMKRD